MDKAMKLALDYFLVEVRKSLSTGTLGGKAGESPDGMVEILADLEQLAALLEKFPEPKVFALKPDASQHELNALLRGVQHKGETVLPLDEATRHLWSEAKEISRKAAGLVGLLQRADLIARLPSGYIPSRLT